MHKQPLDCAIVDNLEVACLYHYRLNLKMRDGSELQGIASDMKRNEQGVECLRLTAEDGQKDIELARIETISAVTDNPFFSKLDISKNKPCS